MNEAWNTYQWLQSAFMRFMKGEEGTTLQKIGEETYLAIVDGGTLFIRKEGVTRETPLHDMKPGDPQIKKRSRKYEL